MTTINNQYPALTSSRKGIFFQTEYFAGNQIASQNNVGYNIVPRNYFTYRHMSDDEIFHFNINDICDFGIVSTLYPVFTTKKELDSKYLQSQLNYGKEFAKFASLQKQGGSRTYMYFAKLKELVLTMPKVEEQTKISSILSNIDNLITLHQRKCTYIFYSWEQRELFDVADYRNGKAHENDIDNDGKYIVINSKFVSTEGKIKKYSNKQNEPLFQNEIAFVLSDVPNGRAIAKTFLVDKSSKYTLNQRIAGITPHSNINPKFLSITMNRNKYFLQFDDGVKQTNLSLNDMKKFEEFYPNKQEQDKIGDLFTNLDNLITLHQHKELKRRNDNNDNLRW